MRELKTGPFCGMAFYVDEYEPCEFKITHPENEDCPIAEHQIWCGKSFISKHNHRPAEDALRADLEKTAARELAADREVQRLRAEVAALKATAAEEVDEFNAGFDAAKNGEPFIEPQGIKHDQWCVGYAWQRFDWLNEEVAALKGVVGEMLTCSSCGTVDQFRRWKEVEARAESLIGDAPCATNEGEG